MPLILGVHVSKISTVLDDKKSRKDICVSIEDDLDNLGLNAAQVFLHGPRNTRENKNDYPAIRKATTDIDLTVHSAYPMTGVWAGEKDMIALVGTHLAAAKKAGAWGWVLHISKICPDVIAAVMKRLRPAAVKHGVKIVLEMVASKADPETTYETPDKINRLTELIGADEKWWGWCVDTAHLWGAGVDIRTYAQMRTWLKDLEFPEKILMFHLNGSSAERGSGKDKHEIPFSGYDNIWEGLAPGRSGVRAIMEFAKRRPTTQPLTVIMEINRGNEEDTKNIIDICKRLFGGRTKK